MSIVFVGKYDRRGGFRFTILWNISLLQEPGLQERAISSTAKP
jgi:hypothetical protein